MDARSIIAKVRHKRDLTPEELAWFGQGLASGAVSDAQAGAFAMAVCLNGMAPSGRVGLTLAMRESGDVLTWDMDGPVIDKHSTGGLGDCVSLVLAPVLAACGAFVPMISGRGLGHTGGTLDKMEAIPGLTAQVDEPTLRRVVGEVGCCIAGATGRIAPADRRLYAIRDVTSTVESIDLITASILSKKLAAGLEALVLDVKVGSGAFMKSADEAEALAKSLVSTANGAGCPTAALITDMNQPLAPVLGNGLEVAVSMEVLAGNRAAAPRLHDLTIDLCARLLELTGMGAPVARAKVERVLRTGEAMERFAKMVELMGGPPDMADDWHTHLPKAPVVGDVPAPQAGRLVAVDGQALGMAVVSMGGGRQVETDRIDPAVGITDFADIGTRFSPGDPICTLQARTEEQAEMAARAILAAVTISDDTAPDMPLVTARVDR